MKTKLAKAMFLRLSKRDVAVIEKTAGHLKLSLSEIARRAIRVGIHSLASADLPGGKSIRDEGSR